MVSNQNIIRILDGLTGTVLNSRTLDPPFQSVDTGGCGDIPNTVGITGTPIIDPVRLSSHSIAVASHVECSSPLWKPIDAVIRVHLRHQDISTSPTRSIGVTLAVLICFAGYEYHVPLLEGLQRRLVPTFRNQIT